MVVNQANLNFKTVMPYLDQLLALGHLEVLMIEKKTFYRTTKQGRKLEKTLRDLCDRMRIE